MGADRCLAAGLLVLALLTSSCAGVSAQDAGERSAPPSIRVMGEATVSARPDQAEIDIGVVAQAPTAQAAATQNAQRLDAVVAELRRALGPTADLRTSRYTVTPDYRSPREGSGPTISGYTATNSVHVKTGDLGDVGKIIDLSTQAGANTINRLQFTLKDEQAARAEALRAAAVKARGQAEVLAAALGLKIVRVLSVAEGQPVVTRPMPYALAGGMPARAATPVEPGTVDVHATVTLTVEVSP